MERVLVKEIGHIDHQIKKYFSRHCNVKKEINMTQFQIVHYLLKHRDEDVCQKDLEIETHLKKASITAAIDALTEKGIVIREQCQDDHRKNYIRLTEESLRFDKDMKQRVDQFSETISNDISKEELEVFYNVIDKIKNNITRESKA